MTVIADFPIDSNVIVILVAVIFAAVKAFLERGKTTEQIEPTEEEAEVYQQYEEELRRQREAMAMPEPVVRPLEQFQPPPIPRAEVQKPTRPKLSTAEKKALENFQSQSRVRRKKRLGSSTRSRLYRHLSSPSAAREALVLADVLGPPKALKEER